MLTRKKYKKYKLKKKDNKIEINNKIEIDNKIKNKKIIKNNTLKKLLNLININNIENIIYKSAEFKINYIKNILEIFKEFILNYKYIVKPYILIKIYNIIYLINQNKYNLKIYKLFVNLINNLINNFISYTTESFRKKNFKYFIMNKKNLFKLLNPIIKISYGYIFQNKLKNNNKKIQLTEQIFKSVDDIYIKALSKEKLEKNNIIIKNRFKQRLKKLNNIVYSGKNYNNNKIYKLFNNNYILLKICDNIHIKTVNELSKLSKNSLHNIYNISKIL